MDVGESGLVLEAAPRKKMNLLLKIVLCFLVVAVVALVIAIVMLFLRHEQPAKKCAYETVADIDNAILETFKLTEGEELDALETLVKECDEVGSNWKYDFRIARALEFNHFDYYELADNELNQINEKNLDSRQAYNYYTARAIVYEALGEEENAIKYRNQAKELYVELYGDGGLIDENQE